MDIFKLYKIDEPLTLKRIKVIGLYSIPLIALLIKVPNLNWTDKEMKIMILSNGNESNFTTKGAIGYKELPIGSVFFLGEWKDLEY